MTAGPAKLCRTPGRPGPEPRSFGRRAGRNQFRKARRRRAGGFGPHLRRRLGSGRLCWRGAASPVGRGGGSGGCCPIAAPPCAATINASTPSATSGLAPFILGRSAGPGDKSSGGRRFGRESLRNVIGRGLPDDVWPRRGNVGRPAGRRRLLGRRRAYGVRNRIGRRGWNRLWRIAWHSPSPGLGLRNATPRRRALFRSRRFGAPRDAANAKGSVFQTGGRKIKENRNDNQSGWKRNPNCFLLPIETFQWLMPRSQEKSILSDY